jgi:hypothetical protein
MWNFLPKTTKRLFFKVSVKHVTVRELENLAIQHGFVAIFREMRQ